MSKLWYLKGPRSAGYPALAKDLSSSSLRIQLSGKGMSREEILFQSCAGQADTRAARNSIFLMWALYRAFKARHNMLWVSQWLVAEVTSHFLRSQIHTFCLYLKSTVFSLWLSSIRNTPLLFTRGRSASYQSLEAQFLRSDSMCQGVLCAMWSWAWDTASRFWFVQNIGLMQTFREIYG